MIFISVYIESEKNSNRKYIYNHNDFLLHLETILSYPFFFPYAYGFIPNTLSNNGREMNALVVSDHNYRLASLIQAFVIGALVLDTKTGKETTIICLTGPDYEKQKCLDIFQLPMDILKNIEWFFKYHRKGSKIDRFVARHEACEWVFKSMQEFTHNAQFEDIPL